MKFILKSILTLFVFAGVFTGGFVWRDLWAHRPPSSLALQALFDPKASSRKTPTELFQEQYDKIIASSSVKVSPERLKYAAMSGMFDSLGDPHTNFLEPADADSLKLETRGDFVGIGARLGNDPSGARVAVVFKGSPAEKYGVKVGDTIIEVDGQSMTGKETDEIVKRIRGQEGTTVKIKFLRDKSKTPIELKIKRAVVVLPSAEGHMLPNENIGYISITGFAQPTPTQMDLAIDDLLAQKPRGLIFDLRGNPGGLLDSAVEMIGRFVEGKPAVSTRKRGGDVQTTFAPFGKVKRINVPVVILVNEDSASAAEIFSGVLQEYGKATLVGEHTYGKSSVQTVKNLIDFSSAKITIAKYFLPSGRDIGRKLDEDGEYVTGGLKPDVEAPVNFEEDTILGEPSKDSQLRKAIDIVKSKSNAPAQALDLRRMLQSG